MRTSRRYWLFLALVSVVFLSVSAEEQGDTSTIVDEPQRSETAIDMDESESTAEEVPEAEPTNSDEKMNASSEAEGSASGNKRLWGAAPMSSGHPHNGSAEDTERNQTEPKTDDNEAASENRTKTSAGIPFVAGGKGHKPHHPPPEGFSLSARVYIDPSDRLAHFDESMKDITLPYWDCGATGATTSPLPLKNGYFRHALASTSTSWTGTDGKHPVLAVALSPLLLELNSGASRTFEAGEVILLEDVLLSGHRMRPVAGRDLKVMFLTLPQQHYHTGKKHFSLSKQISKSPKDPCPDVLGDHQMEIPLDPKEALSKDRTPGWNGRRIRTIVFASVSLSLSTLAADFLGKTAPLWLAVGVGGTCFVAGSTYGLTVLGDRIWSALELWQQQRLLNGRSSSTDRSTSDDETAVGG